MKKGFTLVELLVVVSIFALLAAITLTLLADSRAYARDSNRMSNIEQIQRGLSIYSTNKRTYPVCNPKQVIGPSDTCLSTGPTSLVSAEAMNSVPVDPLRGTGVATDCGGTSAKYIYCYFSDSDTYTLEYHLETSKIKPSGWYSVGP